MTKEERQQVIWWLRRYKDALCEIDSLEIELSSWEDRVYKITHTPTYFEYYPRKNDKDGNDIRTKEQKEYNARPAITVRGSQGITMEDAICNVAYTLEKINDSIERANAVKSEIDFAIGMIDDGYVRSVLRYRYINGLKWEEICAKIPCSWNSVHRWHKIGLMGIRTLSHTES